MENSSKRKLNTYSAKLTKMIKPLSTLKNSESFKSLKKGTNLKENKENYENIEKVETGKKNENFLRRTQSSCGFFKAKPMPKYPPPIVVNRSLSAKVLSVKSRKNGKVKMTENGKDIKIQPFFKARPAPVAKSPFRPKISNRKLTVPIEPHLHTDLRAHLRENH